MIEKYTHDLDSILSDMVQQEPKMGCFYVCFHNGFLALGRETKEYYIDPDMRWAYNFDSFFTANLFAKRYLNRLVKEKSLQYFSILSPAFQK